MKQIKKLLALVLALAICAAFALPALAEGEAQIQLHSVSLTKTDKNHTYTIYQIFYGDVDETKTVLSNVEWGSAFADKSGKVDQSILDNLVSYKDDSQDLYNYVTNTLAGGNLDQLVKFESTEAGFTNPIVATEGTTVSWNVPAGYYMVRDTSDFTDNNLFPPTAENPNPGQSEVRSSYMLKVVGPTTVTPKSKQPPFSKEIGQEDVEPAKGSYNIGDMVPFTLTALIPVDGLGQFAQHDNGKYLLRMTDKMTVGLDFDVSTLEVKVMKPTEDNPKDSISVPVANGETKGYTVSTEAIDETVNGKHYVNKVVIEISNLFDVITKNSNSWPITEVDDVKYIKVVATYRSRLTEEAKMAGTSSDPSAENKAHLDFSNDPDNQTEGEGEGHTPETPVDVDTFELKGTKVAGDKKTTITNEDGTTTDNYESLTGAGFQLYWDYDAESKSGNIVKLYTVEGVEGIFAAPKDKDIPETVKISTGEKFTTPYVSSKGIANEVLVDGNGKFSIKGLPAETYTLVETTTPDGYNTMDPMQVTIVKTEVTDEATGEKVTQVKYVYVGTGDTGSGDVQVVNNKGSQLPSTGGIGTTIFYVVGAVLVVGAGVLLFTKRRIKN